MALSTLTVPQLKALCKEKKISGYSKLGKNALIQKLTEPGAGTDTTIVVNQILSVQAPQPAQTICHASTSVCRPAASTAVADQARPIHTPILIDSVVPTLPCTTFREAFTGSSIEASLLHVEPSSTPQQVLGRAEPLSPAAYGATVTESIPGCGITKPLKSAMKRKIPTLPDEANMNVKKKRVTLAPATQNTSPKAYTISIPAVTEPSLCEASTSVSELTSKLPLLALNSDPLATLCSFAHNSVDTLRQALPPIHKDANTSASSSFQPIVSHGYPIPKPLPMKPVANPKPRLLFRTDPGSLSPDHPDHNHMMCSKLALSAITHPPSLAQRKIVDSWSVILSDIPNEARRSCTLVSKMFRYASSCDRSSCKLPSPNFQYSLVYLSAVNILSRDFRGRRWTELSQNHAISMTNFWPYLRQRQLERQRAIAAYNSSFLPRVFINKNPVSSQLWTSPDHEKQITIATRCLALASSFF